MTVWSAIAPRTRVISSQIQDDDRLSKLTVFLANVALISSLGLLFFSLVQAVLHALLREEFIARNFYTTFAIPLAAIAAFCLVLVLRQWSGHFEAFGLKIQAWAGAAILWLLCFLGITAAIWLRL
jgi:hypothetical protein